jgi:hypothetical protein
MGYIHYFGFVMLATIPSFVVVLMAPLHVPETVETDLVAEADIPSQVGEFSKS